MSSPKGFALLGSGGGGIMAPIFLCYTVVRKYMKKILILAYVILIVLVGTAWAQSTYGTLVGQNFWPMAGSFYVSNTTPNVGDTITLTWVEQPVGFDPTTYNPANYCFASGSYSFPPVNKGVAFGCDGGTFSNGTWITVVPGSNNINEATQFSAVNPGNYGPLTVYNPLKVQQHENAFADGVYPPNTVNNWYVASRNGPLKLPNGGLSTYPTTGPLCIVSAQLTISRTGILNLYCSPIYEDYRFEHGGWAYWVANVSANNAVTVKVSQTISVSCSPSSGITTATPITFTASAVDANGHAITDANDGAYTWNINNRGGGTAPAITTTTSTPAAITFPHAGTYTVSVSNVGNSIYSASNTAQASVIVTVPPTNTITKQVTISVIAKPQEAYKAWFWPSAPSQITVIVPGP
jgi:hypothetical protein